MIITISPAKKFVIMIGLVVVFLIVIHFGVVTNIHYFDDSKFPKLWMVIIGIIAIVIAFSRITYANVFRPFVPGPSYWKEEKYWTPLIIDKSLVGFTRLIYWIVEIFIFSLVLYAVLSHTIHLYLEKIPNIIDGTYVFEYDKMEALFMGAPLVMAFLLFLFICVKLYDIIKEKNK